MKDCTVIIPIYKENPSVVVRLYDDLTKRGYPVIVVNDGDTVELPERVREISYYPNMGYGFAIKKATREVTTSLVCTMDGDGQHKPEDVDKLLQVYNMVTDCKMVIGTRWGLKESFSRKIGRKFLNFLATLFSNHYLIDMNSGLRIFDRDLAIAYGPILCDTFSYTTSLTMSYVTDNYKFAWLPIDVLPREYGKSTVHLVRDGLVTLWYIIWIGSALRTRTIRRIIQHLTNWFLGKNGKT